MPSTPYRALAAAAIALHAGTACRARDPSPAGVAHHGRADEPTRAAAHAARRERRTMTLALDAPSGVVFPLFGPVRESEWDAGWRPEFLFPAGGGQGEEGAVFTVAHPGAGASALWVLAEYDAARRRLQYVRFVPGHYVGQIFVAVAPNGEGKSRAEVTYVWTALSADGGDAVGRFAAEFARRQPLWERAINHYLATGRPLAH